MSEDITRHMNMKYSNGQSCVATYGFIVNAGFAITIVHRAQDHLGHIKNNMKRQAGGLPVNPHGGYASLDPVEIKFWGFGDPEISKS